MANSESEAKNAIEFSTIISETRISHLSDLKDHSFVLVGEKGSPDGVIP